MNLQQVAAQASVGTPNRCSWPMSSASVVSGDVRPALGHVREARAGILREREIADFLTQVRQTAFRKFAVGGLEGATKLLACTF
jgi:hypothetical protein